MRTVLAILMLCATVAVPVSTQASPPSYRMRPLPELSGLESDALCARTDSVKGLCVGGWSKASDGNEKAVLWSAVDPNGPFQTTVLDGALSRANGIFVPSDRDCTAIYLCGRRTTPAGLVKPAYWRYPPGGPPELSTLPTLGGGEGEAFGMLTCRAGSSPPVTSKSSASASEAPDIRSCDARLEAFLALWEKVHGQSITPGGIKKAVLWSMDDNNQWQIEVLPHPGLNSEGAALGGGVVDDSTYVIIGYAQNTDGERRPQIWRKIGTGPWVRTELPLTPEMLGGASAGAAIDFHPGDNMATWGWLDDPDGLSDEIAAAWIHEAAEWFLRSLPQLPGTGRSQALDEVYGSNGNVFWSGTSYNTSPEVDGVATLWEADSPANAAFNINSLVVGDRALEAFAARAVHGPPIASINNSILLSAGRNLGGAANKSGSVPGVHALVLIPDELTGVEPASGDFAAHLAALPNPFQRSISVRFSLRQSGNAHLCVYDVQGRRVATLAKGFFGAGGHEVSWPAENVIGEPMAPGVYFLHLESDGDVQTQKVVQIR
jgi:hypothetical protein